MKTTVETRVESKAINPSANKISYPMISSGALLDLRTYLFTDLVLVYGSSSCPPSLTVVNKACLNPLNSHRPFTSSAYLLTYRLIPVQVSSSHEPSFAYNQPSALPRFSSMYSTIDVTASSPKERHHTCEETLYWYFPLRIGGDAAIMYIYTYTYTQRNPSISLLHLPHPFIKPISSQTYHVLLTFSITSMLYP